MLSIVSSSRVKTMYHLKAISSRLNSAILVGCLLATLATTGQAADRAALNKAARFFDDAKRGQEILNYVHMYAGYHGHEYIKTTGVTDGNGNLLDGQFALVYRFHWSNDGVTDIAFLCDRGGNFYKLEVVQSNSELNQPFLLAGGTIQVLGRMLVDAYKDKMSREDYRLAVQLVNRADAKGLLEMSLRFEQLFG